MQKSYLRYSLSWLECLTNLKRLSCPQNNSQYCDLDDYLQRELEKLQQEEKEESENKKVDVNITDKSPSGHRSPISPTSPSPNAKRQKLKTKSSSTYKDSNKKTFTCTFDGCTKNYVKSSHLKVYVSEAKNCLLIPLSLARPTSGPTPGRSPTCAAGQAAAGGSQDQTSSPDTRNVQITVSEWHLLISMLHY